MIRAVVGRGCESRDGIVAAAINKRPSAKKLRLIASAASGPRPHLYRDDALVVLNSRAIVAGDKQPAFVKVFGVGILSEVILVNFSLLQFAIP